MSKHSIQRGLSAVAFVIALQWAGVARADTISGTIGAIRVSPGYGNVVKTPWIAFKFTDPNITLGCNVPVAGGAPNDYAVVSASSATYAREIFAMLLVSKKGAMISCVTHLAKNVQDGCIIDYCELP